MVLAGMVLRRAAGSASAAVAAAAAGRRAAAVTAAAARALAPVRGLAGEREAPKKLSKDERRAQAEANAKRREQRSAEGLELKDQALRKTEAEKEREIDERMAKYFRTKKHRHLEDDVRFNGSRAHLKASKLRALMDEADRELAVEHLPPSNFFPELYQGKSNQNWETAELNAAELEALSQKLRTRSGATTSEDGNLPRAYDERQLKKYGYALPRIVHVHSSIAKKKTATGNQLSQRTLLAAGNGKGLVGWGVGKSSEEYQSYLTAYSRCLENAVFVPLSEGRTLPHPVVGRFKRTSVMIMPAPRGHGIIAGRSVHPILMVAGVKDAVTKVNGRRNPYSVIMALFDGLRQVISRQDIAEGRGRKVHDFLDPGDYRLTSPTLEEMSAMYDRANDAIERAMEITADMRRKIRREADAEAVDELADMDSDTLRGTLLSKPQ